MFQYISCYSLSIYKNPDVMIYGKFQYISCYSLSQTCQSQTTVKVCFNTSHVTLYPEKRPYQKTAHAVSIHLMLLFIAGFDVCTCFNFFVSIHLMLLFIGESVISDDGTCMMFQYISCYSLSGRYL